MYLAEKTTNDEDIGKILCMRRTGCEERKYWGVEYIFQTVQNARAAYERKQSRQEHENHS